MLIIRKWNEDNAKGRKLYIFLKKILQEKFQDFHIQEKFLEILKSRKNQKKVKINFKLKKIKKYQNFR